MLTPRQSFARAAPKFRFKISRKFREINDEIREILAKFDEIRRLLGSGFSDREIAKFRFAKVSREISPKTKSRNFAKSHKVRNFREIVTLEIEISANLKTKLSLASNETLSQA